MRKKNIILIKFVCFAKHRGSLWPWQCLHYLPVFNLANGQTESFAGVVTIWDALRAVLPPGYPDARVWLQGMVSQPRCEGEFTFNGEQHRSVKAPPVWCMGDSRSQLQYVQGRSGTTARLLPPILQVSSRDWSKWGGWSLFWKQKIGCSAHEVNVGRQWFNISYITTYTITNILAPRKPSPYLPNFYCESLR